MTMIVILVCVSSTSSNYANQHLLDEQHHLWKAVPLSDTITPPLHNGSDEL